MTMAIFGLSLGTLILLFLEVFLSSLGLPIGIASMIAVGSISSSISPLVLVIALAFIAAAAGDIIAYEVGRKLSKLLFSKLKEFNFFKKNERRARRLLDKYGFWIVFVSRFALTNLCAAISYISGLERYKRKKFILAVISGKLLYAAIYTSIGFAVGEISGTFLKVVGNGILIVILAILAVYFGRFLIKRRKNSADKSLGKK